MSEIDWKTRAEAAESKLREIHEWLEQVPFVEKSKPAVRPLSIMGASLNANRMANRMIGALALDIASGDPITVEQWNDAVVAASK